MEKQTQWQLKMEQKERRDIEIGLLKQQKIESKQQSKTAI